jgi:hypothetical protein
MADVLLFGFTHEHLLSVSSHFRSFHLLNDICVHIYVCVNIFFSLIVSAFSLFSALWPFSTLGWPDVSAEDFKQFYPTTMLETG